MNVITIVFASVITGHIIAPSGEYLPGNVNISKKGDPAIVSQPYDPPDSYKFEGLSAGTYQVTALASGYGTNTKFVRLKSGDDLVLDFELKEAGRLLGNVVDPAGNSIEGARIILDFQQTRELHASEELHFAEGFTTTYTYSDRNGFFLLDNVTPNRAFRIVATHAAHTHSIGDHISLAPVESLDVGTVWLSSGGVIEVEADGGIPIVFVLLDQPGSVPHPWHLQRFHRVMPKNGVAMSPRWPVGSSVRVFAETPGRPSTDHVIGHEGPVRIVLQ